MSATEFLEMTTPTLHTRLLCGAVSSRRQHCGHVLHLVPPGQVVVYCIFCRRSARPHAFVVRTTPQAHAVRLLGVDAPVAELITTRTNGRLARLRELFAYLDQRSLDPSALPDAVFLRVGAVLNGRLPRLKVLQRLIDRAAEGSEVT